MIEKAGKILCLPLKLTIFGHFLLKEVKDFVNILSLPVILQ